MIHLDFGIMDPKRYTMPFKKNYETTVLTC